MSRNKEYIKLISSKEWRMLRIEKLRNNPLCESCKKAGKTIPATEVHHITPAESAIGTLQMRLLMFQYNNLISLCHTCHADIHRQMFSHSKEAVKANQQRITEAFIDKFIK